MQTTHNAAGSRLETLDRTECIQLLGYGSFLGRIGFVSDGKPLVIPVNYLLHEDAVVFRTPEGSSLSRLDGDAVAFEVDGVRPLDRSGWSVVVQGDAHRISDADELDALRRGPLRSWAWNNAGTWLRISIEGITGRRLPER